MRGPRHDRVVASVRSCRWSHTDRIHQGCVGKKAAWSPQHTPRLMGSSAGPVPRASTPVPSLLVNRDRHRGTSTTTALSSGVRWTIVVPPMSRCQRLVVAVLLRYCRCCRPVRQHCRPVPVPPAQHVHHDGMTRGMATRYDTWVAFLTSCMSCGRRDQPVSTAVGSTTSAEPYPAVDGTVQAEEEAAPPRFCARVEGPAVDPFG